MTINTITNAKIANAIPTATKSKKLEIKRCCSGCLVSKMIRKSIARKPKNMMVEVNVSPAHIDRRSWVKTKIKIPRLIKKMAKSQ